MSAASVCPRCGLVGQAGDAFCEADGARLVPAGSAGQGAAAAPPGVCAACGLVDAYDEGYCTRCGRRAPATASAGPPLEVCKAGAAAAARHPGWTHPRNEDAVAVEAGVDAHGTSWSVLVVCDGVSSSAHGERASAVAAQAVRSALVLVAQAGALGHGGARAEVAAAIRDAHAAVCAAAQGGGGEPDGTTVVAAVVHGGWLTLGWVGDSRAYWVDASGGRRLTRDHSVVEEAIERGELTEQQAASHPDAHVLTRCIGPLEDADPHALPAPAVHAEPLAGPGHLVLCSDGLWNYAPEASAVAALLGQAGAEASPETLVAVLTHHALQRGGRDNIAVAVLAHAGEPSTTRFSP